MIHARLDFRFLEESLRHLRTAREFGAQLLQRHLPFQREIHRLIDDAHSAGAQLGHDLVILADDHAFPPGMACNTRVAFSGCGAAAAKSTITADALSCPPRSFATPISVEAAAAGRFPAIRQRISWSSRGS